jgi:hypothetical protein
VNLSAVGRSSLKILKNEMPFLELEKELADSGSEKRQSQTASARELKTPKLDCNTTRSASEFHPPLNGL